ncbi:PadR family transcriptional regulator [archaeon]|jgi:PadR family transcriptional regulator, regulatory protein PadR|nr:PadR family transcriptional regulator [archaeon]MBT4397713.1 PadR family transcriptional regulator [archaeon]MBT4441591.1 PadR family transcriptional regulator [archaeon]
MATKTPKVLSLRGFLAFQILHELKRKRLCGDELAENIGKKKGSKLTPGTIYPTLKYLRKKKLLTRKKYGRKKIYDLTEKGVEEYKVFKRAFIKIFKDIYNKKI